MTSPNQITVNVQPNVLDVDVTAYAVTVEPAYAGPQGPKGDTGPTGPAGGETFSEEWTSPTSSLVINHDLGRYPAVVVIIDGKWTLADITYNSLNQINVAFASPQGPGRVECL